jgi:cell division initiation protein
MSGGPSDALSSTATLTADDVRAATFNQSPLAWRGYSEDEVRAFLNQVADMLAAADRERIGLRREVDRLRNFYREHGHDVDVVPSATARHGRDAGRDAGRGTDGSGLFGRVVAYAEVQVERAKEYAGLVERHYDDQATELFHHASVQSALAVEDSIRTSTALEYGYPAPDPRELDRASLWLHAFYDALSAQLQATNDVLVRTVAPVRGAHR